MKIAVTYERASTDMQENSVVDQRTVIKKFAEKNGYRIIKNYTDDGISGASAEKRPSFLQMIDDSSESLWDCVLIYDSSRFARNLMEFLAYKKMLQKNGVSLIAVTEPIIDNEMSLFYDAIMGATNEMYLSKLKRDVTRGMKERTLRGNFTNGAPYGYTKVKHEDLFVINEEEAKFVRYMYNSVVEGKTNFDIVLSLRRAGAKTKKGNDFTRRTLLSVIKRGIYKGSFTYNIGGEIIEIEKAKNFESFIIEPELWEKANKILEERSARYKQNSMPINRRKHWLSGIMKCPHCNKAFSFKIGKNRKSSFTCRGYLMSFCRKNSSINVDKITPIILKELKKIYDLPLENYVKNITIKAPQVKIDYKSEIKKIDRKLDRAKRAYLAEIDSLEEYKTNKNILVEKRKALEEKMKAKNKIIKMEDIKGQEQQFKIKFLNAIKMLESKNTPMNEKVEIANKLIDQIVLDAKKKKIDIYFLL